MENMKDIHWDLLISRIEENKCTPFLGAGACNGIYPLGGELSLELAKDVKFPIEFEQKDLAKVTQYISDTLDDDEYVLGLIIKKLNESYENTKGNNIITPHKFLAQLPISIFMTTNYDNLMYEALCALSKKPQLQICKWNNDILENPQIAEISPETPLVYHLHGHVRDINSLVLTEDSYLDFLTNMSLDTIPVSIHGALSNTSLLFIGYSLNDITFKVLRRGILKRFGSPRRRLNIAVQLPKSDSIHMDFLEQYFDKDQIKIFWGTCQEFIEELKKRWESKKH